VAGGDVRFLRPPLQRVPLSRAVKLSLSDLREPSELAALGNLKLKGGLLYHCARAPALKAQQHALSEAFARLP
tara:strand:- start:177 stop:395 length:219 start_codon:yes stop_codon:yes gene_type:complete